MPCGNMQFLLTLTHIMAWCLLDVKPFPEPEFTVNLDPYKNQ